jgi:cytochrome c peroxidase
VEFRIAETERRNLMTLKKTLSWAGLCALVLVLAMLPVGCQQSEPPADTATPPSGAEGQSSAAATAETPPEPVAEEPAAGTGAEQPKVPLGLQPVPVPDDNPMTADKIELGKLLYFDTRLSKDGTISCATCHDPKMAWTEHQATSTGIKDQVGGRNSPTVINAAYAPTQFWDGRAASLEEQALGPIENPIEMGHKLADVVETLNQVPAYKEHFQRVFGTDVTSEGIAKAIATFERTVLSGNSPYDKFKAGDEGALTDAQKRGLELFEEANCSTCHVPPLFSSYRYFNAGVGMDRDKPDEGRKAVTGKDSDMGKFRVPMLRDVANTGPYFHNGGTATLAEAVALMAAGGIDNPHLSGMMKSVRGAELTEANQKDIGEFLKALSGEYPITEPPTLP